MKVRSLLSASEEFLQDAKIGNYVTDIKILVAYFMQISLAKLYAVQDEEINFNLEDYWQKLVEYKVGKPLQYITNIQNFYGHDFFVNEDVLIPRYETEELVANIDEMIKNIKIKEDLILIDVGTGSGAIGITLGLENPMIKVYVSDISSVALKIARKNATELNCKNVEFFEGDMLEPFIKNNIKADILVCNPPYISKEQEISLRVKDYEPHVALYGPENGLFFYQKIFENWKSVIKKQGFLCFEYGYDQKKALEKMIKKYFPKQKYFFIKDMYKKWRMLFIHIL